MTLSEISEILNGEVIGNSHYVIAGPAKIEDATSSDITFLSSKKYIDFVFTTKAGAIIISKDIFEDSMPGNYILVNDAYVSFSKLLSLFQYETFPEISDRAFVHESATIGEKTHIYPFVYIGEKVSVGRNCIIYPNVTINAHCIIGDDCILHSGAVIGSDGFGFAPIQDGSFHKIPQLGNVILENNVEVGANTCIDRATMGSTVIRKGVKLDNLIQVAHNVEIGEHTVIAAQTGISGSTKIGHHNMIGGQVGFVGHIVVAPYTKINAQSAIAAHIKKEGLVLSGSPAIDMKQHFKSTVVYKNLPDLERKVRTLEAEILKLKSKSNP